MQLVVIGTAALRADDSVPDCSELTHLSLVCPKLVTLLCAGCKRLPDDQLRLAISACRSLATCDVKDCALLSEETMDTLEQLSRRRTEKGES